MDLDGLLARLIELGGSDMHLKIASPAMARIDGALVPMEERLLTESDLETVLTVVTERTPAKREHFYAAGELDTAYMAEGLGRFRVNGYRQRGADLVRLPLHPEGDPELREARSPRRRRRLSPTSTAGSSSSPARPGLESRRPSRRSSTRSTAIASSTSSRSRTRSSSCTTTGAAS